METCQRVDALRCQFIAAFGRETEYGTRTELKNINSFRFIERAIHVEAERQQDLLESGQNVVQETRLFDPDNDETRSMRSKEVANDYRYFPDPDLLPIVIEDETIERIRDALPSYLPLNVVVTPPSWA